MRKIVYLMIMFSSFLFSVEWVKDFDTAFSQAQEEHRIVMVMVESQSCRWCKKMKHRTLGDETVEKRLEAFVTVKVMREDENVMQKLPKVDGVPTIFFMTPDKTVMEEVIGYFNIEDFLSYISDVEKKSAVTK